MFVLLTNALLRVCDEIAAVKRHRELFGEEGVEGFVGYYEELRGYVEGINGGDDGEDDGEGGNGDDGDDGGGVGGGRADGDDETDAGGQ